MLIFEDLHAFSLIYIDLQVKSKILTAPQGLPGRCFLDRPGRPWGAVRIGVLESLAPCGNLWQPVSPSGTEIPPLKQEDWILEASNIGKNRSFDASSLEASGVEVNDDKEEDWRGFPHARA